MLIVLCLLSRVWCLHIAGSENPLERVSRCWDPALAALLPAREVVVVGTQQVHNRWVRKFAELTGSEFL